MNMVKYVCANENENENENEIGWKRCIWFKKKIVK